MLYLEYAPAKLILSAAVAVALTACGGGGGGGGNGNANPGISGTISIQGNTLVDADTAEQENFVTQNNTFADAQELFSPVILGGYINSQDDSTNLPLVGTVLFPKDTTDIFKIPLAAGQSVNLQSFQSNPNAPLNNLHDVELRIYTSANTSTPILQDTSKNPDKLLTLPGTADSGEYFIEVKVTAGGPFSYLLNVTNGAANAMQIREAEDFVAGEVIVKLKDNAAPSGSVSAAATAAKRVQSMGLEILRGDTLTGFHARIPAAFNPQSKLRSLARTQVQGTAESTEQKAATLAAIRELRDNPDVEFAEPNYLRHAFVGPTSEPLYNRQWHYPLINLPDAWLQGGGNGTVVAVIDSGIYGSHEDLSTQQVSGYDFISSSTISLDGDGRDPDPTDPGDNSAGGSSFHGTHVAGTIAAAVNGKGGTGVAFQAKIMPLRVLGKNATGSDADLIEAIKYAAGLPNASGSIPTDPADVINMSLGGTSSSAALQAAVQAAINAGVIVVAAAGNDGSNIPNYPAAFNGVISVAAVGLDGHRAPYSNFGPTIDVAAPGGNMLQDLNGDGLADGIASTWVDDSSGSPVPTYALMQGTSMATPHVAGVAALMKQFNASLNSGGFNTLLQTGQLTKDIGASGRDDLYGYGLIDALKAIYAAQGLTVPTLLSATPGNLDFTGLDTTAQLSLFTVGGNDTPIITAPTDDRDWLSLIELTPSGGAQKTYRVSVDKSGFVEGLLYSGTIHVDYQADSTNRSLDIAVTARKPDPNSVINAGTHFILLVDPVTNTTRYQQVVEASGGFYSYRFTDIEPGEYLLVAGSDLNNNQLICDFGEACAEYPVLNNASIITVVDKELTGTNFSTSFDRDISASALPRLNTRGYHLLSPAHAAGSQP